MDDGLLDCGSNDTVHTVKIYLANGAYNNVRFNQCTTVQKIIGVVVGRFAGPDADLRYYGLRIAEITKDNRPQEFIWLNRELSMNQVLNRHNSISPTVTPDSIRYELRIRYLNKNLEEMYRAEKATFYYFYDQIRRDYLQQVAPHIDQQQAIELGCVEIRRKLKDMQSSSLDKKSNLEFLETEIGLHQFFPPNVISSVKPKSLRKSIQQHFKKLANFSEEDCMFRFLELLTNLARFDIEIFKCFLGTGWSVPIDIIVGPDMGISYVTDTKCAPTKLADFVYVTDIQTVLLQPDSQKATVILKISGEAEPLMITCPSLLIAESLADLIDGYYMLHTQQTCSVWSKKEWYSERSSANSTLRKEPTMETSGAEIVFTAFSSSLNTNSIEENEFDADYSSPSDRGFELDRSRVTLGELLGEGQFGDVYRAVYETKDGSVTHVAVKVCKIESEASHGENFLEEAFIMQQFDHPHIIKLIGICSESPIWIVMELAAYGELRLHLAKQKHDLDLTSLLLYCDQICMALSYLASRKYVHRDIAARNILVFSNECVKLSDFGLSRWVEEKSFYTATKGKLPIKWMAPESINFRRFTLSSDVWMLGVCIWEILSLGAKPFQGIRNHDVIHRLEEGVRLPMPALCPPQLYTFLLQMWTYEPSGRPTALEVKEQIHEFFLEEKEARRETLKREKRRVVTASTPSTSGNGATFVVNKDTFRNSWENGGNVMVDEVFEKRDDSFMKTHLCDSRRQLEETLEIQRKQSEEDSKWLQEEEHNFLAASSNYPQSASPSRVDAATSPLCETADGWSTKSPRDSVNSPPVCAAPPGMEINRQNDDVYSNVIAVVKCITNFSKTVPTVPAAQFVDLVKDIGDSLRMLLETTHALLQKLPSEMRVEVEMAEKVLNSNMQKLVTALRFAVQHAETTLDVESKRQMLVEAHVLAVECKNFLQAVDSVRIRAGVAKFTRKAPNS